MLNSLKWCTRALRQGKHRRRRFPWRPGPWYLFTDFLASTAFQTVTVHPAAFLRSMLHAWLGTHSQLKLPSALRRLPHIPLILYCRQHKQL